MVVDRGGEVYRAAQAIGCEPSEILDFSSNLNPLGPPKVVQRAAREAITECWSYPESNSARARAALSEALGIAETRIILGAGASDLIYLIARTLRVRRALIVGPTTNEYARAVRTFGGHAHFLMAREEDDFRITSLPKRLKQLRPAVVFLCNPNNPTGVLHQPQVCRDLIKHFRTSIFVIDESFLEYVDFPERYSLLWENADSKRIIILKSLSSIISVPGIRIGLVVCERTLAATLHAAQEPWPVGQVAQAVASTAFLDVTHFIRTRELVSDERRFFISELSGTPGLKIFPSSTNFVLLKITKEGMTGRELGARLLKRKMLVQECSNFPGLGGAFMRISLRTRRDNLKLAMAIREELKASSERQDGSIGARTTQEP